MTSTIAKKSIENNYVDKEKSDDSMLESFLTFLAILINGRTNLGKKILFLAIEFFTIIYICEK